MSDKAARHDHSKCVMYPNTPGARFNHEYYRDKHMPLVKARMGDACKSYTVDKALRVEHPELRRHMSECVTSSATPSRHSRLRDGVWTARARGGSS
jgi:uncharacterized protein (TIGR02118 family)